MRQEPGTGIPKRAIAGKVGRNGQVSTLHRRIFVKELQIILGAVSNDCPTMDEMAGLKLP